MTGSVQLNVDSGHGAWWCLTDSSCRRHVRVFRDNFIVAVTLNASCWWLHAFIRRWCDYVRQLRQLRDVYVSDVIPLAVYSRANPEIVRGDDEVGGSRAPAGSIATARPRWVVEIQEAKTAERWILLHCWQCNFAHEYCTLWICENVNWPATLTLLVEMHPHSTWVRPWVRCLSSVRLWPSSTVCECTEFFWDAAAMLWQSICRRWKTTYRTVCRMRLCRRRHKSDVVIWLTSSTRSEFRRTLRASLRPSVHAELFYFDWNYWRMFMSIVCLLDSCST